jgi:SMODS and SLOG-associating 2TM effector domain 1
LSLILTTQVLAIGLAFLRIVYPRVPLSPVSFLMTGASSMLAWTQSKRHEDLVEPYAVAAQELRELGRLGKSVTDSQSLRRFVSDVEETISREHTKWLARRSIETGKPQPSGAGR